VPFNHPYETSRFADVLLPDHLPLESWGYQRLSPAVDRALVSAIQPVVSPRYDTRSTVDLLLDAIHRLGGELAAQFAPQIPFRNEAEYLHQAVMRLPWPRNRRSWTQWRRKVAGGYPASCSARSAWDRRAMAQPCPAPLAGSFR
jgi:anaerobic selenocysteine-containing dehydrogenase